MQTSFRETSKNRAKFSIKNLFSRIFIRIIALTYVFFKYDFIFHDRQITLKVRKIYKYNEVRWKLRKEVLKKFSKYKIYLYIFAIVFVDIFEI